MRVDVGVGGAGGAGATAVLVTGSAWLAERVGRCAAVAGAALHVETPGGAVAGRPRTARLEVLGEDALSAVGAGPAGAPAGGGRRLVVAAAPGGQDVWRRALEAGAERVLLLPDDDGPLVDALLRAADDRPADAVLLAVVGGCGGAGASTAAAALAWAAAGAAVPAAVRAGRPPRVLLVDLDALGGGADVLLGVEGATGLRWSDLSGVRGTLRPDLLDDVLPGVGGVDVLAPAGTGRGAGGGTGDDGAAPGAGVLPLEAVRAVVAAARRSHDVVVLDAPRDPGLLAAALGGAADAATVLVVVPPRVRAGVAAGRLLAVLGADVPVHVLVREAPDPAVTPAQLARALGAPLAGVLPVDDVLADRLERGLAPARRRPGPLLRAAAALLADHLDGAASSAPPAPVTAGPRARRGGTGAPSGRGRSVVAGATRADDHPRGPGWRPRSAAAAAGRR